MNVFRAQLILIAFLVGGAFWLRAVVTDFQRGDMMWCSASVFCAPCGVARGLYLWHAGEPMLQRKSSASSAPNTPALVNTAPSTTSRLESVSLS